MNWPLVLLIAVVSTGAYLGHRVVKWMYPLPEDEE